MSRIWSVQIWSLSKSAASSFINISFVAFARLNFSSYGFSQFILVYFQCFRRFEFISILRFLYKFTSCLLMAGCQRFHGNALASMQISCLFLMVSISGVVIKDWCLSVVRAFQHGHLYRTSHENTFLAHRNKMKRGKTEWKEKKGIDTVWEEVNGMKNGWKEDRMK